MTLILCPHQSRDFNISLTYTPTMQTNGISSLAWRGPRGCNTLCSPFPAWALMDTQGTLYWQSPVTGDAWCTFWSKEASMMSTGQRSATKPFMVYSTVGWPYPGCHAAVRSKLRIRHTMCQPVLLYAMGQRLLLYLVMTCSFSTLLRTNYSQTINWTQWMISFFQILSNIPMPLFHIRFFF